MNIPMHVPEVETVRDPGRAQLLLNPIRQRILAEAVEPSTASQIARRMMLPPQKVNYHVRALVDAALLEPAGEGLKRNLVEKRYRASARSYVLLPQVLGAVGAGPRRESDELSAAHLHQLVSELQAELAESLLASGPRGEPVPTLSFDAEFTFESAEQRARFGEALRAALVDVIGRHASAARPAAGDRPPGRPFRLIVGCYPQPTPDSTGDPS